MQQDQGELGDSGLHNDPSGGGMSGRYEAGRPQIGRPPFI